MSAEQQGEKNLRVVQDAYAAFARGDIGFVLNSLTDELQEFGVISAANTGAPWHAQLKGKAGAARYFELLGGALDFKVFEPGAYAATGDHVYATLHMEAIVRATGKRLDFPEVMHHITFRDGKIVRWRCSEDTALSAAALRQS